MKYANFLVFIFLGAAFQSALLCENSRARACAKILVYNGSKDSAQENKILDFCYEIVVKNLLGGFSEFELQEYYEALHQKEIRKMFHLLQGFCGGMYNFHAIVTHRLYELCKAKKHTISSESLFLEFNKEQYELSTQESEESSQDYYKQIIEWSFDFKALQEAILKRHAECAVADLKEIVDMYGWSEKTLLLSCAFSKMTLNNYYFYCVMLNTLQRDLHVSLKEAFVSSDISTHEIIKIHKFLHSPLGKKALLIHKECMRIATEEFLKNVKL